MRNDTSLICALTFSSLVLGGCASGPSTFDAAPTQAETSYVPAVAEPSPESSPEPLPGSSDEVADVSDAAPELKPSVPLRYTVKKGDTLWSIANHFLRDSYQWPELWYVNPKVKNPHQIFPGDVLELVFRNGRPVLARSDDLPAARGEEPPPNVEQLTPVIRESPLTRAVPAIPIDAIRNYLRGPRLVTEDELDEAPYLLEFHDEHLFGGAGAAAYVRGLTPSEQTEYTIVRKGTPYVDPDDDSLLGYEALPIAESQVTEFGDPSTVKLKKSYREARGGDRLLVAEAELFNANFYPHAPAKEVGGRIISLYNGLSQIGQYQIVAMNRGTNAGLEPGHVLHVFEAGRKVRDPYTGDTEQLPPLKSGVLMVFKVTERVSYGLVMTATRTIRVLDMVEKPK